MDVSLSKLLDMVKDREACETAVHGHKQLNTTEQLNNHKLMLVQTESTLQCRTLIIGGMGRDITESALCPPLNFSMSLNWAILKIRTKTA